MQQRRKAIGLIVVSLAAAVFVASLAPLPQDTAYHRFADTRTLFGVPNFWNVASNLPFVLVGIAGLYLLARRSIAVPTSLRTCYAAFFAGVLLTAAGSAWYHLDPRSETLVWDRLPITVAFMGLTSAVIGELISPRLARHALPLLLSMGVAAVTYWAVSESRGAGDLRPYVLVQFLPLLLIPLMLVLYESRRALRTALWSMLALYVLAKCCELFDAEIFDAAGILSGHSLKHLLAAAASALPLRALPRRCTA